MRSALLASALFAWPYAVHAQDAVISGVVTDSTGGILPGVTITASHEASGNTFEAVTDQQGAFRLAVRPGVFRVVTELAGFTTVTRAGVELLVGQQAVINLQMSPSGVTESVTVTAEAPLIDTSSSSLSGNIDPRQMAEIPVNGRDWQDLAMMAPGMRANNVDDGRPSAGGGAAASNRRDFQLNMDGQQVTQMIAIGSGGSPLYSKDAIAEFQVVASRFDATQGRSSGIQLNAIGKSGTNQPSGTVSAYFRNERLNAADFIAGEVLPYSEQQVSTTFGGPIRRDRVHIFGNYEYQRNPDSFNFSTPYPSFNITLPATRSVHIAGARLDVQLSPQTRLMLRGDYGHENRPVNEPDTGLHPAGTTGFERHNESVFTTLTQVLSNNMLNEIKGGFNQFDFYDDSVVSWPDHPQSVNGFTNGAPQLSFIGFTIGQTCGNCPQHFNQNIWSVRDDLTYSFTARGRHDVKLGGELMFMKFISQNCRQCNGIYDMQGGAAPANLEELIPVWNDISTWNLAALSPITRVYRLSVGTLPTYVDRYTWAGWLQDDWAVTSRLTLNLGVRYDLSTRIFGNEISFPPDGMWTQGRFLEAGRPNDTNNIAPRIGFAYRLTDRTVVRGGYGEYFTDPSVNINARMRSWQQLVGIEVNNDGRPNFAADPFNGPIPTVDQARARLCSVRHVPGCLRWDVPNGIADPDAQSPSSRQGSVGVQRQLHSMVAVEADYVYVAGRHEYYAHNFNINYDPATGANLPFTVFANRPYPEFGRLGMERMAAWTTYHALQAALTKRFSHRWQASLSYTLGAYWDGVPEPMSGFNAVVDFPVAPDLGYDYSLSAGDQRHRAVVNGIWEVGRGFQLSGLYFYGSGMRFSNNYGGDRRNSGGQAGGRLRPDGTLVERNSFVGQPLHRVDLRAQQRIPGIRPRIDLALEVFNLFNHENYGAYTTAESNARYGLPNSHPNVVYRARMVQLGFRTAF
jgi:hypothetical protein